MLVNSSLSCDNFSGHFSRKKKKKKLKKKRKMKIDESCKLFVNEAVIDTPEYR